VRELLPAWSPSRRSLVLGVLARFEGFLTEKEIKSVRVREPMAAPGVGKLVQDFVQMERAGREACPETTHAKFFPDHPDELAYRTGSFPAMIYVRPFTRLTVPESTKPLNDIRHIYLVTKVVAGRSYETALRQ
jgi:hypothetical protein